MLDKSTMFFDDERVLTGCYSTPLKVGANGKGAGSRFVTKLGVCIRCTESYDSITGMVVELVESNDKASWTPVKGLSKMEFAPDDLVEGVLDINTPLPNSFKDWIALKITITGTPNTGKLYAGIDSGNTVR